MTLPPSLRKAAVLMSSLDERTADALYEEMGPEQAAKVRRAVVELAEISAEEQEQVLAEFLHRQGSSPPARTAGNDDVLLELGVEPADSVVAPEQLSQRPTEPSYGVDHRSPRDVQEPPFAFLARVDAAVVAAALRHEQPQTIAVIVGQLPPQQAAVVLERLPGEVAIEALERMATLGELAPETLVCIAMQLRDQLAPHLQAAAVGETSLAHLGAVVAAMHSTDRERIVRNLTVRNAHLVRRAGLTAPASERSTSRAAAEPMAFRYRIAPIDEGGGPQQRAARPGMATSRLESGVAWLPFDDFASLDDAALKAILAKAPPDTALLALTGADARLVDRILRQLPAEQSLIVRHRLENPGAVRLREIEDARSQLASIATRLAHSGHIAIPRSLRFAMAV